MMDERVLADEPDRRRRTVSASSRFRSSGRSLVNTERERFWPLGSFLRGIVETNLDV